MIEYGGVIYYIDLKALDKFITLTKPNDKLETKEIRIVKDANGHVQSIEEYTHIGEKQTEINITSYEVIRTMIDTLLDWSDTDDDTTLGADRALSQKPLSYQICFNTLTNYGILKEKE
jgi:hypothetical protein